MSEQVRVIHGPNDASFDRLAGKSIGSVRRAIKQVFSLPEHAQALLNGSPAHGDCLLHPGDIVEFVPTGWGMKGALEPDELEKFVRRIDRTVKKLAEEGLFRLRLNDVEKEVIKTLFQKTTLKGDALAKRLQRAFDSNFKATLAALVRHGLLDNNDEGYFIPPTARRHLKETGAV
jgi:hypothetical protein